MPWETLPSLQILRGKVILTQQKFPRKIFTIKTARKKESGSCRFVFFLSDSQKYSIEMKSFQKKISNVVFFETFNNFVFFFFASTTEKNVFKVHFFQKKIDKGTEKSFFFWMFEKKFWGNEVWRLRSKTKKLLIFRRIKRLLKRKELLRNVLLLFSVTIGFFFDKKTVLHLKKRRFPVKVFECLFLCLKNLFLRELLRALCEKKSKKLAG